MQSFIDTIKLNSNLAEQLRTLVIMPPLGSTGMTEARFGALVEQVLGLCHELVAIVAGSYMLSSPLPLFQSPGSSRRLLLLSTLRLRNEDFPTFMINFNNYASLQVMELSVISTNGHTLPSFPDHITFPSLHTLLLGYLDPPVEGIVGKWELPSLKALSISRWNPLTSMALLPLIQRSYESLEFFDACVDLLHNRDFYGIIRFPPFHLRNVTLSISTSAYSSPPSHKIIFSHVVTLGICKFGMIRPEDKAEWVRFLSDPTYMRHLRSVLTDVTIDRLLLCVERGLPLLDVLRAFEKVLEDRGVAFEGVTDDKSTFVPIKLLQLDTLEVTISPFYNRSVLIISLASKWSPWEFRAASVEYREFSVRPRAPAILTRIHVMPNRLCSRYSRLMEAKWQNLRTALPWTSHCFIFLPLYLL